VFVASGNVRPAQHSPGSALNPADTLLGKLSAILLDYAQARSTAN
jgi:hypothetical protein